MNDLFFVARLVQGILAVTIVSAIALAVQYSLGGLGARRCSAYQQISPVLIELCQLTNTGVEGRQVSAYCPQLPLKARYAGKISRNGRQVGIVDVLREPGVE